VTHASASFRPAPQRCDGLPSRTLSYRTTVSEGFDVPVNFAGHMRGAGQVDDLRAALAMPALQTCLRVAPACESPPLKPCPTVRGASSATA